MYYPCSENKGADKLKLCIYCTADLRLCFRIIGRFRFSHESTRIITADVCMKMREVSVARQVFQEPSMEELIIRFHERHVFRAWHGVSMQNVILYEMGITCEYLQ